MQLKELRRTLVRRWYLTILGAMATAGLVFVSLQLVPPTYEVTADVVLLPPESSVGPDGNPYLYLGGLDQAVDVLTRAMTSDAARAEVLDGAGAGEFDVTPDWTTSGPILIVTAHGATAAKSSETLTAVLSLVPKTLLSLQTTLNVPTDSRITSMVLTEDDKPSPVLKTRLRAVGASAIAGLVLSGLLIGLVDGLLTSRKQRREDRPGAASGAKIGTATVSPGDSAGAGSPEEEFARILVVPHQLMSTSRPSNQG